MSYVYKNEVGRPINIGGYQFAEGQELQSDILIERFKEAVSNKFLSLKEVKKLDSSSPSKGTDSDEEAERAAEIEAARKAEEDARLAEEARKAEEERLIEEAKKAEEARLAEQTAEAQRIADEEAERAAEEDKATAKKK